MSPTVGPPDASRVPAYTEPATFARLPRIDQVGAADVAIVGIPFDSGVSYRPGARFGPGHVRAASNCCAIQPGAGRVPVRQPAGRRLRGHRGQPVRHRRGDRHHRLVDHRPPQGRRDRADPRRRPHLALPILRSLARDHGPLAVLHFDAHLDTWDTYFGAPYTHGTPFRRASEEGLIDMERSLHIGIRGPLYGKQDLEDDAVLGFQIVRSDDYEVDGVAEHVERMRARLDGGPVYVSVDIDVLDPAHAPGTGTPEAGGLTSRELLNTLRGLVGLNVVGADIVEVAPAYDHAEITGIAASHVGYELLSVLAANRGVTHALR